MTDQVPDIGFLGIRNQPKNGFKLSLVFKASWTRIFFSFYLEGSAPLMLWSVNHRREELYLLRFLFGLMYQCPNGAIPSRKCSIKAPDKWRNSIYVLTEICHQRSKCLGPKRLSCLRTQSFTSLMACLHLDINRVSSFSRCLNGTFP